jgi:histidinol dehydrogenase
VLRRVDANAVTFARRDPVDAATLAAAGVIMDEVRAGGVDSLRAAAVRFGDLPAGGALVVERPALLAALTALPSAARGVLERTAERITAFAAAQRRGLVNLDVPVPGGRAGIDYTPVDAAGCYAPGGRYPLPSSVLMTACTARAAGVGTVWVASPRPAPETLAAAALAGADGLLAVGGAQAIAALAYGIGVPAVDAIVGPGNRWVTAAKQRVAGRVAIEGLAGPSELVVIADAGASPGLVAADLLAQAEHDPDALVVLITTSSVVAEGVDLALAEQLVDLPTAEVARVSVRAGFCVVVPDLVAAAAVSDALAPEHLALHVAHPSSVPVRHYGAAFLGAGSAEVFGDYGAGPNHVLPTSGTARSTGALSVVTFLRARTWLRLDDPGVLAADAAALARLEGLEAHARAAERRRWQ